MILAESNTGKVKLILNDGLYQVQVKDSDSSIDFETGTEPLACLMFEKMAKKHDEMIVTKHFQSNEQFIDLPLYNIIHGFTGDFDNPEDVKQFLEVNHVTKTME